MKRALVLAMCLVPLLPALARAQAAEHVERGMRAYLEADFASARAEIETAIVATDATARDLSDAYRVLAVLDALEQRTSDAQRDVVRAVALDSEARAPEGAPRALVATFARERDARGGRVARVAIAFRQSRDGWSAIARLEDVPAGIVARIALRCVGSAGPEPLERISDEAVIELALGDTASAHCEAEGLTATGAAILRAHAEVSRAPTAVASPRDAGDPTPWIVGGTIAGAVLVAGALTLAVLLASAPGSPELAAPSVLEWP